jgi:hypothetical protein
MNTHKYTHFGLPETWACLNRARHWPGSNTIIGIFALNKIFLHKIAQQKIIDY